MLQTAVYVSWRETLDHVQNIVLSGTLNQSGESVAAFSMVVVTAMLIAFHRRTSVDLYVYSSVSMSMRPLPLRPHCLSRGLWMIIGDARHRPTTLHQTSMVMVVICTGHVFTMFKQTNFTGPI